jgi:hypothetical protein
MKKRLDNIFDELGEILNSMSLVTCIILLVIFAGCFFSHTLFFRVFPNDMTLMEKRIASWVLALAWEMTITVCTTNSNLLPKRTSKILAICSGIILLFFVNAISVKAPIDWIRDIFSGVLIGFMNYVYPTLFVNKWKQHKTQKEASKYELELIQAQGEVSQLREALRLAQLELIEYQIKLCRKDELKAGLLTKRDALKA